MPNSMFSLDASFPQFTGGESEKQKVGAIYDYLIQLQQTLRYCLQNLGGDNFNDTELEIIGNTIREPVYLRLTGVESEMAYISLEAGKISARMEDAEGNISQLQESAQGFSRHLESLDGAILDINGDTQELSSRMDTAEGRISQVSQKVDSYTIAVTNGKAGATLQLKAGETVLSSQEIKLEGVVTFTKDSDGYSKIDGGYLRCDNIDAEKGVFYNIYAEDNEGSEYVRINRYGIHFFGADAVYTGSIASDGNILRIEGWTEGGVEFTCAGPMTIGKNGKTLNLLGNVYVNGTKIS